MEIKIQGIEFEFEVLPNKIIKLTYNDISYYMPRDRLDSIDNLSRIYHSVDGVLTNLMRFSDVVYNNKVNVLSKCRWGIDNMVSIMYQQIDKNPLL
jgi:hypothetical protein